MDRQASDLLDAREVEMGGPLGTLGAGGVQKQVHVQGVSQARTRAPRSPGVGQCWRVQLVYTREGIMSPPECTGLWK